MWVRHGHGTIGLKCVNVCNIMRVDVLDFKSISYILIHLVGRSVCRGLETQITFNKIVFSNSRAQKLFRTSSSYFYIRFRAATVVVDGGGIFGIWRVGEKIWVHFFWAKGLGRS